MSTKSNDQGRAYEYAWMQTLYKAIAELRKTRIVENSSLVANEKAWSLMDEDMQEIFMTSAGAAIDMVLELEPRMAEVDSDELTLEFQKDGQGVKGDVRDIVIKRKNIEWEIGLSIKHNHDAVKHSTINEQISNFAQTYPTNLKASSNEALLFMRRYRFANCSCFSCCFKDAYPSSNVQ